MSHFIGLVINTPKYLEKHNLEDALAPYDENTEVPEYVAETVSDYEKISFLETYLKEEEDSLLKQSYEILFEKANKELYERLVKEGKVQSYEEAGYGGDKERYYSYIAYHNQEEYVALVLEKCPDILKKFDDLYAKYGDSWNRNSWRKNIVTDVWEEFSTYNPKSKWDWYQVGGRWDKCLLTKSGELVNECLLGELDFEPFKDEDYEATEKENFWGKKYRPLKESVKWHLCADSTPFCLVVDGQWIEKGEMGWWAMTSNEKPTEDWNAEVANILAKLPADAEVTAVDFHI